MKFAPLVFGSIFYPKSATYMQRYTVFVSHLNCAYSWFCSSVQLMYFAKYKTVQANYLESTLWIKLTPGAWYILFSPKCCHQSSLSSFRFPDLKWNIILLCHYHLWAWVGFVNVYLFVIGYWRHHTSWNCWIYVAVPTWRQWVSVSCQSLIWSVCFCHRARQLNMMELMSLCKR